MMARESTLYALIVVLGIVAGGPVSNEKSESARTEIELSHNFAVNGKPLLQGSLGLYNPFSPNDHLGHSGQGNFKNPPNSNGHGYPNGQGNGNGQGNPNGPFYPNGDDNSNGQFYPNGQGNGNGQFYPGAVIEPPQLGNGGSCPLRVWSPNCPTSPSPFKPTLSPYMTDYIVKMHNYLRSLAGNPSKNASPMRWNSNLAQLAEGNTMQCALVHDNCPSMLYRASAQNLALHSYSGNINAKEDNELIKASIDSWWNEYKSNKKQDLAGGKRIGIGCAAARFYKDNMHKYLFVCNYATLDIFGQPEPISTASELLTVFA